MCVAARKVFCKLKCTSVSCLGLNAANDAFLFPSIFLSV